MLIAQVVGDLTATQKHPSHEGLKLLLVQPLNLDGSPRGNPYVAVDSVNAGLGSKVLLTTDGFAAFTSVGQMMTPIDAAVIGIVDSIDLAGAEPASAAAPAESPKKRSAARPRASSQKGHHQE
jgi:ethanolamine utilization protein EutN